MTEITVVGAAEEKLAADIAALSVTASFRSASRDTALADAQTAHAATVARACELVAEGAALSYAADPVSTYSNSWRDEAGETVTEHNANISVRIVLTALERVGEISAELSASGVDVRAGWELSDERQGSVIAKLRGAAVNDARAAATDYAAAIGAPTLELIALRDSRVRGGGPSPLADARFAMAAAAPEVTVGEIAVSVQLEAVFAAS